MDLDRPFYINDEEENYHIVKETRRRILVVEDDESIQQLISTILSLQGYDVILSSNGAEALLNYDDSIDLIITDIEMPVMDGIELIKEIRTYNNDVKIVVVTGSEHLDIPANIKTILKPFKIRQFLETVFESIV